MCIGRAPEFDPDVTSVFTRVLPPDEQATTSNQLLYIIAIVHNLLGINPNSLFYKYGAWLSNFTSRRCFWGDPVHNVQAPATTLGRSSRFPPYQDATPLSHIHVMIL